MNVVIILNHIDGEKYYKDIFVNGKLSMLDESIFYDLPDTIVEKINLDSYLTAKEQYLFFLTSNSKILFNEQEAILNGEIDYAFDLIKERLKDYENNYILYHTNIEADRDRYQEMTREILDYILEHQNIKEVNEIYDIIKKWAC